MRYGVQGNASPTARWPLLWLCYGSAMALLAETGSEGTRLMFGGFCARSG